jgi:cation transporter-like permease
VVILRYLDVCLVLATAPFVLVGGMPTLGYLIGACAWLLTRAGTGFVQGRAQRIADPKLKAGLQVAAMMGRIWIVALAVILARFAGGKSDGIMAAALVLAAFTVYFVMSFITRPGQLSGRPRTHGRPSPS